MSEGDAFGELALLHNIRRTATIICKENSEFLRVDKPDFDEVSLQIDNLSGHESDKSLVPP